MRGGSSRNPSWLYVWCHHGGVAPVPMDSMEPDRLPTPAWLQGPSLVAGTRPNAAEPGSGDVGPVQSTVALVHRV